MPARKMRIELYDNIGDKYIISLEGQITREKVVRILDLVELLGGVSSSSTNHNFVHKDLSKYDKVCAIIQKHFPIIWFSSKEAQFIYEQEVKEPISLSTISTYLARMVNRKLLIKTGNAKNIKYKITPSFPQAIINQ